jgi:hypothetical protein
VLLLLLLQIGGFGDPVGRLGPLKWPSDHELQQGFNTEELQRLKPLFESCVDVNPSARPNFEQVQRQLQQLVQQAARAVQAKAAAARSTAAAAAAAAASGASNQLASIVGLPAPGTPGGQQQQQMLLLQQQQQPEQQQQQPEQQQQQPGGLVFMPSICEMAEGEAPNTTNIAATAAADDDNRLSAFAAPALSPTAAAAAAREAVASKPTAGPGTPVPSAAGVGGFGMPGRMLDSSSSPFAWMSGGPQLQPPLASNFMSPFMAHSTNRMSKQAGDS